MRLSLHERGGFPILMYHHVAPAPPRGSNSRYMFVGSARFRRQMQALRLLGYVGCSMRDLGAYLDGRRQGRAVGITFDDGYRNVHRNALPALRAAGFTSTTYFVSRQIDGYNEWDVGHMPYEPCMSRAELREWADAGQEVGAHTLDHARLAAVDRTAAWRQIEGSRKELEDMTGEAVTAFSYPFGSHDDDVVKMVREAGFTTATTTRPARAAADLDPLRLPRITVRRADLLPEFLWKHIRGPGPASR